MNQIGVKQLTMGFLNSTESGIDSVGVFLGQKLIKVGRSQLSTTLTGVTYALSQSQSFFIIFDSDFCNKAVVQKTYWADETYSLYQMLMKGKIQGKKYPNSTGFFMDAQPIGQVLVEYQVLKGEECVTVSQECVL